MDKPIVLHVGKQEVQVIPSAMHEYVMTTEQVALGYGVTQENVRQHKATKREELQEGKHWTTVSNPNGGAEITYWTKRGVIRLGFFIRSARARTFRDMAEDLVLKEAEKPAAPVSPLALSRLMLDALEQQETRIVALEQRMAHEAIRGPEIKEIHKRGVRLGTVMGGSRVDRRRAWNVFNDRFNIAAYRDLPSQRFEEAVAFLDAQIKSYEPAPTLKFTAGAS